MNAGKARDTLRLQLALLSHIFETTIKEWRIDLWIENLVGRLNAIGAK